MTASGLPVKEKILNNLQSLKDDGDVQPIASATGLGLISTSGTGHASDGDYYTDPKIITRIDASPLKITQFPAIVIEPLSTDYDGFGSQGTLTIAATFRIRLRLMLHTRTNAVALIERFIRDAHRAILVDRQRASNAIVTQAVSDSVQYPTDDDEAITTATLLIAVDYRTAWNDLNSPT
jgi:hypothetical protein